MTARARRLARWAAMAAAVALVAALARTVDWSESWRAMRSASPALLLAAGLVNLASLVVRGTRWWLFLRATGAPSWAVALRGAVVGSGLNNVLPANGGDAARVLLVARREGVSSAAVLATVALDRLVEFLSCVALLAAAPLVVPLPAALARWRVPGGIALVVLLVLVGMLARRAAVAAREPFAPAAALPEERGRLRAYLARFAAAMTGLPTPRRLAPALALSLLSWIGQALVYHLTARATGLPASLVASVAAMLAVNLAFLVQLTPGNVGIFQLLYALVMAAYGVSHDAAVGTAVVIQALQILPITLLALLLAPELAFHRTPRAGGATPPGAGDLPGV